MKKSKRNKLRCTLVSLLTEKVAAALMLWCREYEVVVDHHVFVNGLEGDDPANPVGQVTIDGDDDDDDDDGHGFIITIYRDGSAFVMAPLGWEDEHFEDAYADFAIMVSKVIGCYEADRRAAEEVAS